MFFRRKKTKEGIGTITVIESQSPEYKIGPDLARLMNRVYFDLCSKNVDWPKMTFKEKFQPRVISRAHNYSPEKKDGKVIFVDSLIRDIKEPVDLLQIVRSAFLYLRAQMEGRR